MASFTNMATLSYNGSQINSNVVTGELLDALTVTKTAVSGSYRPGDTVTYVVTLTNTGTALTGLTLTDDLGGYTAGGQTVYPLAYEAGTLHYYTGGTEQTAPAVTAGPPMTVTGVTVPAGGNVTLVYQALVTEFAPPGVEGEIRNTVTVTGGGLAAPLTATATTAAQAAPELSISKALCPAVVTGNGPLTYTFTVQNTGNTALTGQEGAVITDTFEPTLTITGVTFNGAAWTSPEDYTYDAATGAFATVAGKLTVPEATFTQNADGSWTVTPGQSILTVTGTV